MKDERRRRGFERAGAFRLEDTGLSAKRVRQLRLELAWRRGAGNVLAQRAALLGVRRGVLEVEVTDAAWAATLRELLPRLAGRVAAACPAPHIRQCRVVLREPDGSSRSLPAEPVVHDVPEPPAKSAPPPRRNDEPSASVDPDELQRRLLEVARRQLARGRATPRRQEP